MHKEIRDYVKEYSEEAEAKRIIDSTDFIDDKGFNLWSLKKLILLDYYLRPYLLITRNNFDKVYFIDFFSSCGASQNKKEDLTSIGSPIISLLKGAFTTKKGKEYRFDKWFFVDCDGNKCKHLTKRVEQTILEVEKRSGIRLTLGDDVSILEGDSNVKIDEIISELKEVSSSKQRVAILAFIDPYNYSNIEWSTFEKLLELKHVDIIFTLPTMAMSRNIDICKEKERYLSPSLLKRCDGKSICNIPRDKFSSLYAEDIAKNVGRSISFYERGIVVCNSIGNELYRIHLFTHCKNALRTCQDAFKLLDSLRFQDLRSITQQAQEKQKSLADFFGNN